MYGSALTFYEVYPEDKVNEKHKQRLCSINDNNWNASEDNQVSFHVIKCICLLSHWPFFDAFEKFLLFLYQMSREGSCSIPIERYLNYLSYFTLYGMTFRRDAGYWCAIAYSTMYLNFLAKIVIKV